MCPMHQNTEISTDTQCRWDRRSIRLGSITAEMDAHRPACRLFPAAGGAGRVSFCKRKSAPPGSLTLACSETKVGHSIGIASDAKILQGDGRWADRLGRSRVLRQLGVGGNVDPIERSDASTFARGPPRIARRGSSISGSSGLRRQLRGSNLCRDEGVKWNRLVLPFAVFDE